MTARAVRSLRWSARLLGANSPSTMCSDVMIMKEITTATECAAAVEIVSGSQARTGSIRRARAGSPIQPRASDEMVMPSWGRREVSVEMVGRPEERLRVRPPLGTSSATRLLRIATRANSAATKKPFARTRQGRSTTPRPSPNRRPKYPPPVDPHLQGLTTEIGHGLRMFARVRRCLRTAIQPRPSSAKGLRG